jgi:long-chain acyl-CoA synthetase
MAGAINYQDKPWLKSYQQGVPEHIDFEEICIPDILERTAVKFPQNDALIIQGFRLNFTQLKEMVDKFATCLTDFGVKKGDPVAILLPNLIPCVAAYFAILKIGAITVMNDYLYSDRELEYQLNDSEARVLVTTDLQGNRMIDLRYRTKIKQIVITSIGDDLPFPKNLWFSLTARKKLLAADVKAAPDVYHWKDCMKKYPPHPPQVELSTADTAMYQYTGGTTGVSKGVELTHSNLSKQVQQLAAWLPSFKKGSERSVGALPYFHVFGMSCGMNFSVFMGWSQVLIPQPRQAYEIGVWSTG